MANIISFCLYCYCSHLFNHANNSPWTGYTFSCHSRHKDMTDHAGPGPGTYNVVGIYNDGM